MNSSSASLGAKQRQLERELLKIEKALEKAAAFLRLVNSLRLPRAAGRGFADRIGVCRGLLGRRRSAEEIELRT